MNSPIHFVTFSNYYYYYFSMQKNVQNVHPLMYVNYRVRFFIVPQKTYSLRHISTKNL